MRHAVHPRPEFPTVPGVYLWREGEEIIYIGKAKNLRNRLHSYYRKNVDPKTKVMLLKAETIEWVVLDSEQEALHLEEELIKRHRPPYNILLKDDKQYPYVAFTDDEYPRLVVARDRSQKGWQYWGPYTDSRRLRTAIRALNQFYFAPLWGQNWQKRGNPPVSLEMWQKTMAKVQGILEGSKVWQDDFKSRMQKAAKELKFEYAAKLRDWQVEIDYLTPRRKLSAKNSYDVLGWAEKENVGNLQILQMRADRLVGRRSYTFENASPEAAILEAYKIETAPSKIYFENDLQDLELIQKALQTKILPPKENERYSKMAKKNAANTLQYILTHERVASPDAVLKKLMELLSLKNYPSRIECYDISNIGDAYPVGAMAVMINGLPQKSAYRRWRLEATGQDDFAMLQETLRMRLKDGKDLPDLIVIDGGKGQLYSAYKILKETKIPLISLAKREEEVFLIGKKEPLELAKSNPVSLLLQRLRDETHKTAVNYHREYRDKGMRVGGILSNVRGLGPKRQKLLLDKFGEVEGIMAASQTELESALGSTVLAEQVYRQLHR